MLGEREVRRLYVELRLTEAQLELLRRTVDEAATSYAETNPLVKLLRKIEHAQKESWPDA